MKGRSFQGILFIFWVILATLSTFWITFTFVNFYDLLLKESIFQFIFILSIVSLIIALVSIYDILVNAKQKIIIKQELERDIRDSYRYQQLLNPPDSEMNN